MNKFTYLYKRLNSTFWFKPLLIVMLGFVLSIFFLYLDTKTGYEPDGIFRMILSGSSESARSVLSAIASAMIGVAGTVFSITLVVLTLATNQFGSRLLRNFMYQNMNQIVLGSYAGTYLYCLIVLNAVKGQETFTFVPNISVLFSLVLAVVNLVLLIFFIHHVSVSIQSHNVIENIVQSFKKQSDTIYPEEIGFDFDTSSDLKQQLKAFTKTHVVSQKAGYLQYVDEDIYQYAIDHGFIIKVHHRPGHYIIANIPIATIYNVENEDVEEINKTVSDYLPMDRLDTDFQNPEFSIHQIVEVACRALSAGINDNYTVITCIDKLTYILSSYINQEFPSPFRADEQNNLRLIFKTIDFNAIVDTSFNQIRQFGANSPAVIIHLMQSVQLLLEMSYTDRNDEILLAHARKIMETAEKSFVNTHDLTDLQEVYLRII